MTGLLAPRGSFDGSGSPKAALGLKISLKPISNSCCELGLRHHTEAARLERALQGKNHVGGPQATGAGAKPKSALEMPRKMLLDPEGSPARPAAVGRPSSGSMWLDEGEREAASGPQVHGCCDIRESVLG